MPVYELSDELVFPDPSLAEEDGLLAIGGDLSIERLILAYSNGIFPWYDEGSPILWWALNPRMVLLPENLKVSKSLKQSLKKGEFSITFDKAFEEIINECSRIPRKNQQGTWITDEMKDAYINLHKAGFAHSVECYSNNELVGGLYGVSLGKVFFGESMFHLQTDASKIAFHALMQQLKVWDFQMVDAQMETPLLKNFGAYLVPFEDYREKLYNALEHNTKKGNWTDLINNDNKMKHVHDPPSQ
jgi:leucyl/phenylalanyl-tRNA--protein transferase